MAERAFHTRVSTPRKELSMNEHATNSASRVEGKDIHGKLVIMKRTNPAQLSLFQTFLPDDDKYSNTIELYDAIPDLIESLKICSLVSLSVMDSSGKALIQSPIFPVLLIASKADWMENPKQTRCYVQFHPLVTASINHTSYRQYDYLTYMAYKHRMSRWLHKRLAHNYVQASIMNPYSINLSTILRDSGALYAPPGSNAPREA